jgi:hypothetical protein
MDRGLGQVFSAFFRPNSNRFYSTGENFVFSLYFSALQAAA